jgi:hypothetical protein
MATNPNALAREIVAGRNLFAVVLQISELDAELEQLLRSVRRHFPVLPLLFVTDAELPPEIDGEYAALSASLAEADLVSALRSRLAELARKDRRRYHRYDWPLTGAIVAEAEEVGPEPEGTFNIRSISAGGAFLEQRDGMPEPGTSIKLRVHFQGAYFETTCNVLDRRMASSHLPPGQGVQFTSLSQKGRDIVDAVVKDALMTILLDPTAEPDVPSLDEEEMELSLAPEFTIG